MEITNGNKIVYFNWLDIVTQNIWKQWNMSKIAKQ